MDVDSFSLSFSLFPLTCVPLSAGSSGWLADWLPAVCGGDGCWHCLFFCLSLSLSAGCCGPSIFSLQVGVTGRCGLEAGVRV